MTQAPRILLVAGEASGDLHAAELLEALHGIEPGAKVFGIGGAGARAAGMETWIDLAELAAMGLVELRSKARAIWTAYRRLRRELLENPPDLAIFIDFPEFNLALAKVAKRAGVPVLFYVSPQVWAWRRGRVKKILRRVDALAVILPFEPEIYGNDPKVHFVGHPLVDSVKPTRSREETLARHGLDPHRPLVALLPGSRRAEIGYHLPVMVDAAYTLAESRMLQFAVAVAPTLDAAEVRAVIERPDFSMPLIEGDTYDLVHAADLVLTSSGTATVEVALLERPMVLMYRLAPLTYALARLVVRVDHIGMPNVIAGREIVPELVQDEVTPEAIARAAAPILDDPERAAAIRRDLAEVRAALGAPGAALRAAKLAASLLPGRPKVSA